MYRLIDSVFGLVNKKSRVIFYTPNRRSFGECVKDMYYGLLLAKREGKKVLFIYPRPFIFRRLGFSVVNRELFDLESEYILPSKSAYGFIAGCLLSIYVFCLFVLGALRSSSLRRVFQPIWPVMTVLDFGFHIPRIGRSEIYKQHDINFFSWEIVETQHWEKKHETYAPPRLKESKRCYAEKLRVQLGIPLTDWFVCLHLRNNEPNPNRNQSIENCIEGIKAITNAGGWVVRLGDPTMTPFPPTQRVIDYAHSPYKSELMDLYLISQCKFFLGISSGPYVVANLFKKPVLLINMTDWGASMILKKNDLGIIKHVFSRSRNRFLSIKEILQEPSMIQIYGNTLDEYELVENSSTEICEAVVEFLTRPDTYEHSNLQNEFNVTRKNELRRCLEQGEPRTEWIPVFKGVPEKDLYMESYRISAAVYAKGTLADIYLKKNWHKDETVRLPTPTRERS